jgi:hypothetical protein
MAIELIAKKGLKIVVLEFKNNFLFLGRSYKE